MPKVEFSDVVLEICLSGDHLLQDGLGTLGLSDAQRAAGTCPGRSDPRPLQEGQNAW